MIELITFPVVNPRGLGPWQVRCGTGMTGVVKTRMLNEVQYKDPGSLVFSPIQISPGQ